MGTSGATSLGFLQFYRFRDTELENEYHARWKLWCIHSARVYWYLAATLCIALVFLDFRFSLQHPAVWLELAFSIMSVSLIIGSHWFQVVRSNVVPILCASMCLLCAFYNVLIPLHLNLWLDTCFEELLKQSEEVLKGPVIPEMYPVLQRASATTQTNESIIASFLLNCTNCFAVALLGWNRWSAVLYIVPFVAFLPALFTSVYVPFTYQIMRAFFLALFDLIFCYAGTVIEATQRSAFLAETRLAQELQASQMADSVLNHMLKNTLAEVAMAMELFLQGSTGQKALEDGIISLRRGIRSCKERQVYLRLVAGDYTPVCNEVDLKEFTQDLIAGRTAQLECRDLAFHALMDQTLCGLILENAISNAIKHGKSPDPEVCLSVTDISAEDNDGLDEGKRRIRFAVTNIVPEGRVPLTPEYTGRLLRGEARPAPDIAVSSLSDRVGLSHCMFAAKAGGISLDLSQAGDRVSFTATLDVRTTERLGDAASTDPHLDQVMQRFPPGLQFFCLDDSPSSLKLMEVQICHWCQPGGVHCYGAQEADVSRFLTEALGGADILILDQNLEYSETYYGAQLAKEFRRLGFRGLICIRSSDDSDADRAIYAKSGANCSFGKDMPGERMMQDLKAAYVRLRDSQLMDTTVMSVSPMPGSDASPACKYYEPSRSPGSRMAFPHATDLATSSNAVMVPIPSLPGGKLPL